MFAPAKSINVGKRASMVHVCTEVFPSQPGMIYLHSFEARSPASSGMTGELKPSSTSCKYTAPRSARQDESLGPINFTIRRGQTLLFTTAGPDIMRACMAWPHETPEPCSIWPPPRSVCLLKPPLPPQDGCRLLFRSNFFLPLSPTPSSTNTKHQTPSTPQPHLYYLAFTY